MAHEIDVDHPAVGAAHLFIPGGADALVAAALLAARAPHDIWVMIAREHRLPLLLERPLADAAKELWCLGYAGTGDPLLPSALEAHVSHRPVYWLSTTSGRLSLSAQDLPGLNFESLPGGSLVLLVQRHLRGVWDEADYAYERLGMILGRSRGARPAPADMALANLLHAASVAVRNNEHLGARLVRSLADSAPASWSVNETLLELAAEGERLIGSSRAVLESQPPNLGDRHGPALWLVDAGEIARGAHGKAVAAQSYYRQSPTALIERAPRGITKAWVVLPRANAPLWHHVSTTFGQFSDDFSYTGLRGAGALPVEAIDEFAAMLWADLNGAT